MKQYDNIRIFRAAACLGVFLTHLGPYLGLTGGAAWAANQGASGVYLFFLISGFLACGDKEFLSGKKNSALRYYKKRLLRLLPLYYAVVLYNMALHILILKDVPPDPDGLYWLRYFLMTNAWLPAPDNFWANLTATWTVCLFFAFYLLAPVLVQLIRGVGSAFFSYVLALLLRYLWTAAGLADYMMIFYYLHYFVLGMLVYHIMEAKPFLYVIGKSDTDPVKNVLIVRRTLFFAGLMAAVWLGIFLCRTEPDSFMTWSWVFGILLLATRDIRCKSRILQKIDLYSYEIYLVHAVVLDGIGMVRAHISIPVWGVAALAFGLTAVGAFAAKAAEKCVLESSGLVNNVGM